MKEYSPYKSLAEWRKDYPSMYAKALKVGWIDELCETFGFNKQKKTGVKKHNRKRRPRSYWTKENIIKLITQYSNRGDWVTHDATTYRIAKEEGWLDEIYALRGWKRNNVSGRIKKPKKFWDIDKNIFDECRKHKVKRFWKKASPASYKAAYDRGLMAKCEIILEESFQKWMDEIYQNL
tara:strand:+ start:35814 stop:36350 length:537 start_codon:yes stop_codon:yes gene_type:complete